MDEFYKKNLINNLQSTDSDTKEGILDGNYYQMHDGSWKGNKEGQYRWPGYARDQKFLKNPNYMSGTGFGPSRPYDTMNAGPSALSLRDVPIRPAPPRFDKEKKYSYYPPVAAEETSQEDPQSPKDTDEVDRKSLSMGRDERKIQPDSEDWKKVAEPDDRSSYPTFRFMKKKIIVGICASEHPFLRLSSHQLEALRDEIQERILTPEGQRAKPRFYGTCIANGILRLSCGDEKTAAWVKELSEKLDADGVRLKFLESVGDSRMFIAVGYFPKSRDDPNKRIIHFLESQNEGLDCSEWRVLDKTVERNVAVRITFSVDFASAQLLKVKGPLLNFKFGAARFLLKTKRGISFMEEDNLNDDEDDCMDSFPVDDKDFTKPFSFDEKEPALLDFSASTSPHGSGDYDARVAKVVQKSRNALRFGLTSRERYLSGVRSRKSRKKFWNKGKKKPPEVAGQRT